LADAGPRAGITQTEGRAHCGDGKFDVLLPPFGLLSAGGNWTGTASVNVQKQEEGGRSDAIAMFDAIGPHTGWAEDDITRLRRFRFVVQRLFSACLGRFGRGSQLARVPSPPRPTLKHYFLRQEPPSHLAI
jgi:hypothetical protein